MLFRSRRPRDRIFNLTVLRYVWRHRHSLLGVYYFDDLGDAVPVLDLDEPLPQQYFEVIDEDMLKRAPKLLCLTNCGACCEIAGVFAFAEEIEEIRKEGFREVSPRRCEKVRLLNGEVVKVCEISRGSCPLYDRTRRVCLAYNVRPTICRVVYCTLVAECNGRIVVKMVKKGRILFVPYAGDSSILSKYIRKYILRVVLSREQRLDKHGFSNR